MRNTQRLSTMLALIALPMSAVLMGSNPALSGGESAHRDIQLTQARELLGSDSIHLASAGLRKLEQVNGFITGYVARSIKAQYRHDAARVAHAVIAESQRHGFDPLLMLAVIQNESRFDPSVIGTHGEIGLMQIKPDTAEWIARKARIQWRGAEALHDPAYNIRLGTAYMAMLRSEFGYNKDLFLAAYNMGAKNVRRILGTNSRPQVYAQKTIQHYSRIYIEFMASKEESAQPRPAALAAI